MHTDSDLFTLYETLWEDVNSMCITVRSEGSITEYQSPVHMNERERRQFVRSVFAFAFAEATLFYIKNEIIDKSNVSTETALAEQQVQIKSNGEITTSTLKISFINNL